MRGGLWGQIAYDCRNTLRNITIATKNDNDVGFRLYASI
jgi:formylglycine-generating enzyme required for sulfatase activity